VPDADVAFKILALNTEKAHNLREKSLETIRMARALAKTQRRARSSFAFEFEQPSFLTLGDLLRERPRSAAAPINRSCARDDVSSTSRWQGAQGARARGAKILKLDDAVSAAVEKLKAKGLTSPYLKPFVVARVNYTRFVEGDVVRLRRDARQDHHERVEVQTSRR
jgi:ParB family chromosome partitioning protein